MKILAVIVLPDLEDDRVQPVADPTDRPELLGDICALIQIVRLLPKSPRFFESNASSRILSDLGTLFSIEFES